MDEELKIGKIPNDLLKKIIFNKLKNNREEVLLRPKIGEDCTALDFDGDICLMSTDPITGASNELGKLAVYISCNDIASCGAVPIGILVTLLAPPGTIQAEIEMIMDQMSQTAASINVDILGGHTEITSSVTRIILNCTAVGRAKKGCMITTGGALPTDMLVLTKTAGFEGTAILAFDKMSEISGVIDDNLLCEAKSFIDKLSVIPEGIIAADFGVNAMHDVTEGGVLGAIWEMCEASETGVIINKENIPVAKSTLKICEYFNINPLKLISSGCMLIACCDGEGLVKKLKESGIDAAVIGLMNNGTERILLSGNDSDTISAPGADELFNCNT